MSKSVDRAQAAEQWAERIGTQLGRSVESIIEVGRLLTKAKADLAHGEWGRIFDEKLVPFSPDTAQRLMSIAASPQLSNTAHARYLPPSWTTLYELTKLPEPTLKHALADGLITPDMPRNAVKALLPVDRGSATRVQESPQVVERQTTREKPEAAPGKPQRSGTDSRPVAQAAQGSPDTSASAGVQGDADAAFEMPRWADEEIRDRVDVALQPVSDLIEAWPDDQGFAPLVHRLQQLLRYIERLSTS